MATSLETMIKFCSRWQIEALTLLSLLLQVILIVLGSKRKVTASSWISGLVWCAYLSADTVATVALGILARAPGEEYCNAPNPNQSLQAFWAPFFLLHLGGPDTITAYSLEDNELWLRHLLYLILEVGVAIYVFFSSWGSTDSSHATLSFIAIPVYIAGIINYGERSWVLWSSSTKRLKRFLVSIVFSDARSGEVVNINDDFLNDINDLLFSRLKALFSGFMLPLEEGRKCYDVICMLKSSVAFKLIEFELGLMYDVLYTKATIVYSGVGIFLRCITFLASVSALVTFSIIIGHDQTYSTADISVTYILLVGAVFLEVYALAIAASSDWTKMLLGGNLSGGQRKMKCCSSPGDVVTNDDKRRSRGIPQFNVIKFCLPDPKEGTAWLGIKRLFCFHDILKKHRTVIWKQGVDHDLKDFIFQKLHERTSNADDFLENYDSRKKLLNYRGDCALKEKGCLTSFIKKCTVDIDFSHSLFLWHVATQLCYHVDVKREPEAGRCSREIVDEYSKISKCLSGYMIYLAFMCPDMLPKDAGLTKCKQACAGAAGVFKLNKIADLEQALEFVLQRRISESGDFVYYGLILANQLQNLNWGCKEKWEMMNQVWVELLTYAASHCGWKEHAHQLRKGGELLTHVGVLMAYLGLSEQYQFLTGLAYLDPQ